MVNDLTESIRGSGSFKNSEVQVAQENTQIKKKKVRWAPLAHACNLSYWGDKDHEDHGMRPVKTKSS
jgi:hypothetical protein